MSNKLISEEIYPNIVVYKNTFKNIEKIYDILENGKLGLFLEHICLHLF